MSMDNEVYVKRLFRVPKRILARSDNPSYPEFELKDGFLILGRVIYRLERM